MSWMVASIWWFKLVQLFGPPCIIMAVKRWLCVVVPRRFSPHRVHGINVAYCYRWCVRICVCWAHYCALQKPQNLSRYHSGEYTHGPKKPCIRWGVQILREETLSGWTYATPLPVNKYIQRFSCTRGRWCAAASLRTVASITVSIR